MPDLESQYASCSLRVLIQKMHQLKAQGLLTASDPKKEYARCEQEYVNQFPYFLDLFDRYPAIWGLVVENRSRKYLG